jgi:protein gp37
MSQTSIEWTDAVWNPVRGCTKISPGCKNCYAETLSERFRGVPGHPYEQGFDLRLVPEKIAEPLRWRKPRRVFVNSMSDLFHEGVPFEFVAAVFGVMAACPQHTFQVLTKRPERMLEWFEWMQQRSPLVAPAIIAWGAACDAMRAANVQNPGGELLGNQPWPPPNVWLGVSVENRKHGLPRINVLREVPAAVRFLSVEPLLEDLGDISHLLRGDHGHSEDDGGTCLSCGGVRRANDRQRGNGVEGGSSPVVSLDTVHGEHRVLSTESGEGYARGVSTGPIHGEWRAGQCTCSPTGMETLQRTSPRRHDREPQEWDQGGQPSQQPGVGHSFRANNPRHAGSGVQPRQEPAISWVIVGGESGHGARPMHPEWARRIRDQCVAAGVAFFFKQWGEWIPRSHCIAEETWSFRRWGTLTIDGQWFESTAPWNGHDDDGGGEAAMRLVGKAKAGRALDGRSWDEMPQRSP